MSRHPSKSGLHDLPDHAARLRDLYPIDRALRDELGVQPIGQGTAVVARCPFHEDHSPSLSINIAKGVYKCHAASCGASGDLFTLLAHTNPGLSFPDLVRLAASRIGYDLPAAPVRGKGSGSRDDGSKPGRPSAPVVAILPQQARDADGGNDETTPAPDEPALVPLPEDAPVPEVGSPVTAWHPGKGCAKTYHPVAVHVYRDEAGRILGVILRCEMAGRSGHPGRKYFIPLRAFRIGETIPASLEILPGYGLCWMVSGPPSGHPKPLYGAEMIPHWRAAGGSGILVVDGEKTADAARRLLVAPGAPEGWMVLSGMGGCKAAGRADWGAVLPAILAGEGTVRIAILPDADDPVLMKDGLPRDPRRDFIATVSGCISTCLKDAGLPADRLVLLEASPPSGKGGGWDLADAEAEGWDGAALRSLLEAAIPVASDFDTTLSVAAPAAPPAARGPAALPLDVIRVEDVGTQVDDAGDGSSRPLRLSSFGDPYFRCLGHREGVDYFVSLDSGHIYGLTPNMLKPAYLLKLARKEWWAENFMKPSRNGENAPGVNWEDAIDALVAGSYAAGVWDPAREIGQGACRDGGRIVFNTGSFLHVEGAGVVPIRDFRGDNCYVMGPPCRLPDFDNPFQAEDPALRGLLDIIRALNWRPERRSLSILALFGWMAIGPISGILKWRPHLWLDGPRSAGKSWITANIIRRVLGDYCVSVKSNSTEAGIRAALNAKAFPLIFDEAEGETKADRDRMDAIIRMARHSSSETQSVVLQGTPGGAGQRYYSIRSTFLFASITPQIEASADRTRFVQAQLGGGRGLGEFVERIEIPSREVLTDDFASRFVARMILRAPDFDAVFRMMIEGISGLDVERRLADVYGTFAAGAWLALRDGIPEDRMDAMLFLRETFGPVSDIRETGAEVAEDKDHIRLCRVLQAAPVRFDIPGLGMRTQRLGSLIACASGWPEPGDDLDQSIALAVLRDHGIRPAISRPEPEGFILVNPSAGETRQADCLVIHKNCTQIHDALANTSYARAYAQVLSQAEDVRLGKVVRFSASAGVSRTLIVPLAHFSIGEGFE